MHLILCKPQFLHERLLKSMCGGMDVNVIHIYQLCYPAMIRRTVIFDTVINTADQKITVFSSHQIQYNRK